MCVYLLATFHWQDFLRHFHFRDSAFHTFIVEYSWLACIDVGLGAGDSAGVETCNGFVDAVDLLILTLLCVKKIIPVRLCCCLILVYIYSLVDVLAVC